MVNVFNRYWKLRFGLERRYYDQFGYPQIAIGPQDAPKRALLAYLSVGLRWKEDDPRFGWRQNLRQSRQIAMLLIEKGYRVDVVQFNDEHFTPAVSYDLAVVHPGKVSAKLQETPKTGYRLCLRTGRHADFVDRVVAERYAMLGRRRKGASVWGGTGESNRVYQGFDAIACFDGDGRTVATFAEQGLKTFPFRNYANPGIKYIAKDFGFAARGYVYIANQLHVSKGLDWLIEAFAERSDLQLYICGRIPRDLRQIYRSELTLPNIHALGFVDLLSNRFSTVCRQAAWFILPSATEGCSGASLDAMAAGLVPILSDACSVATGGIGLEMAPCTQECVSRVLDDSCTMTMPELEQWSRNARDLVTQRYSPNNFITDWRHILDAIESHG